MTKKAPSQPRIATPRTVHPGALPKVTRGHSANRTSFGYTPLKASKTPAKSPFGFKPTQLRGPGRGKR